MKNFKKDFLLRDDITYLNFGSFGACPKPIFENYIYWQYELEKEPVQFLAINAANNLKNSIKALATYINCDEKELVLVTNPSYAVNIIAKSFPLKKGDEILTSQLEYGACEKTWKYYCNKSGAVWKTHTTKLPLTTKEELIEDFFKKVNKKTKLIFLSHITSSTAIELPVNEICKRAKELGIPTFIDGAHAPGQTQLDFTQLQADIYTGACHKWMMTPKGCSFLYVKKEWQHLFDPLVISWGYQSDTPSDSLFFDYHQMQGTRDFSAMLTIPAAIEYMQQNNWDNVRSNCRNLIYQNAPRFFQLFNQKSLAPLNETFIKQMCSVEINCQNADALQNELFGRFKIEIPITKLSEKKFIRFSIQAFNTQDDLDKLYDALNILKQEKKIN